MEGFWVCSDCGSPNSYPNITECEVCGKIIDDNEKKEAEKNIKKAVKTQDQIKRSEEKEEKLRKQQERDEQRRAAYEERQKEKLKRIRKKNKKRKSNIKKYIDTEKKIFSIWANAMKIVKSCLVGLFVVGVFIVGVSVVRQDSIGDLVLEIESIVMRVAQDFEESHYIVDETGEKIFTPFINIEQQLNYLGRQFEKSENLKILLEILGW